PYVVKFYRIFQQALIKFQKPVHCLWTGFLISFTSLNSWAGSFSGLYNYFGLLRLPKYKKSSIPLLISTSLQGLDQREFPEENNAYLLSKH
ncbi:hypothetical protein, partial [uncultured Cyclobacterium sp.]|uniref:hypothetical protein n=1 Tax=uncultured Cyclobacterium sp. TaxID=453820 RepID=UPI0030ECC333